MAKKSEYSFGEVTGYDLLKEVRVGGERSRKVKRCKMKFESTIQKLGFC